LTIERIEVIENKVLIQNLEISQRDIADYLRDVPEEERKSALVEAIEVGIFSLRRAKSSQDTEFVKRRLEALLNDVQNVVGKIPQAVEKNLISKIGADEGQVLAPIRVLVDKVSATNTERLNDVKNLLSQEIDPGRETSTIGKALGELKKLLNPDLDGSVQKSLESAVNSVIASNGTLSKSVKEVVSESIRPLANEVDRLGKEIREAKGAENIIEQTTLKGELYELEVVKILQEWARVAGAEIHHVGRDINKPGDILVKISPTSTLSAELSLVIEVKMDAEGRGRKRISDMLQDAMSYRKANAAIFLSRDRNGLANEIGEWAEGELEHGPWVATVHEHLTTAVRFLIVKQRLDELRKSSAETDPETIIKQVERIRTDLRKITNINTNVTQIKDTADAIGAEARGLRTDIQDALSQIESAVNSKLDGRLS
jgi:hypothetical protein